MELFAQSRSVSSSLSLSGNERSIEDSKLTNEVEDSKLSIGNDFDQAQTFQELGMCEWVSNVTRSVGYRQPTPIQRKCIPSLLRRQDVLAGAETGSGKTASYILPLLQILSEDPYGIFAVILAPTRELAIQISEQLSILGSSMPVTVALVVGGLNFVEQSQRLSRRPHFIVATPGRFRQQLETADAPNLKKVQFVIFDEADKLISTGFAEDLEVILSHLNPQRTTGFFSATLTNSLKEISSFALKSSYAYIDLTKEQRIPESLQQHYLLTPTKIKICYLVALLFTIFQRSLSQNKETLNDIENIEENPYVMEALATHKKRASSSSTSYPKKKKLKKGSKHSLDEQDPIQSFFESMKTEKSSSLQQKASMIIFVDTCQRCYELTEILLKFNFPCVALHSLLSQSKRLAALTAFKSLQATILIATDVASRGLDIPTVQYVINFNLPKILSDYIHRVGRTSRAGREGQSITFITQHDIHLLKRIESYCQTKMEAFTEITPRQVKGFLIPVAQVVRTVKLDFENSSLVEVQEKKKKRKMIQRQQLRKYAAVSAGEDDDAATSK